jgi:hypothetical protein
MHSSIDRIEFGIIRVVKDELPSKKLLSIKVIEFEMAMFFNAKHLLKQHFPIEVTEFGIISVVNEEQN